MGTYPQGIDEWALVSTLIFDQPKAALNQEQLETRNIIASPSENLRFLGKICLVSDSGGASVYLDLQSSPRQQSQRDIESYEKHLLHWVEKQLGSPLQEGSYKWIPNYRAGQEDVQESQGKEQGYKE